MEEEHDCAVFDRRGRRARRPEASSDGYIIKCDAGNSFVVEELLAEVYESLRCGKGSGCSPPCVTRWSGGAVVHDRGALLRRGLRRRTTTHHVVELGSQHYRGQFNVVPGTVFFTLVVTSSCARSTAGGDVLSTRSTGIVFNWWWWCWCLGGGAARRRLHSPLSSAAWLPHGRSAPLPCRYGSSASAEATARSASLLCASTAYFLYRSNAC